MAQSAAMSQCRRADVSGRIAIALIAMVAVLVVACGSQASPSPASSAASGPPVASVLPTEPAPSESAAPSAPPAAAPPTSPAAALGTERLTILLAGFDNTTEREHSELTDSLIVASLDPVSQTVSMIALPRDLTDFPLPGGSTYHEKLNSLYVEIKANPARYGGKPGDKPLAVLAGVVGNIIDVPIEHWAEIDMDGFAGMIDALGGIDYYVQDAICVPGYHQLGVRGFEAKPGWWHLSGPQALGLARVRHYTGGSDFQRIRRQFNLLVAIRDKIVEAGAASDPLGWLARIPSIRTDLPPETIVAAGALVAGMSPERFNRRVIEPGAGNGGTELYDSRGYVLRANMDEIRAVSKLLFTDPGNRPTTGRYKVPPDKPSKVKNLPRFNGC
jgi:LCP family protein required for cell wall assembly